MDPNVIDDTNPFNRTIEELKLKNDEQRYTGKKSFNRTIEELKLFLTSSFFKARSSF